MLQCGDWLQDICQLCLLASPSPPVTAQPQCNERPANLDRNQTGVLYLPRTTLLHSPFIRLIYTSNVLILLIFLMHIHISKQKCYFQNLPVISQIVWGVRFSERPTSHLTLQQPDTADCPPARELSGPTTLPGFPLIWFGRIWIRKILASYKDLSFLYFNGSNCPLSLSPFFVPLVWRGGCWMAGWWLYQHIRFAAILRRVGGRWEDKELNSFLCPPPLGGQCLLWEYQGLQTQTQTYNLDRILQITGQWSYHFYKEII